MNPLSKIPDGVRLALYALYALAGPVLIYTATKGWTGDAEFAFYTGIGTALGITAASNVNVGGDKVNQVDYIGAHRDVPDEIALGPEGINAGDYEVQALRRPTGPTESGDGYVSGVSKRD